jgi:chaperonin GroES
MLEPLGKRLVVKRDPTVTEINGFIVPEQAQEKEQSGTVLAIGKEVKDIRIGERVIFGKFDGQDLKAEYAEEDCIIINEEQIKAIYV